MTMSNSPAANIDRSSIEASTVRSSSRRSAATCAIELQLRRAEIDHRHDRAGRGIERAMLAAARRQAEQRFAADVAPQPAERIDRSPADRQSPHPAPAA